MTGLLIYVFKILECMHTHTSGWPRSTGNGLGLGGVVVTFQRVRGNALLCYFFGLRMENRGEKKKRRKLLIMESGKSTKTERLTEYNPICPSPSFSNYQLTVSLHPLQLLWPQMILKQIPDVRAGLGSGDALVIKFLGYSPCLHKHVSAEELGDLSLRKTRSKSTSICVILQLCRGLAVTKSSMGRAALPPWILLGKAFVTAYSQA